jgi:hypothetical protein
MPGLVVAATRIAVEAGHPVDDCPSLAAAIAEEAQPATAGERLRRAASALRVPLRTSEVGSRR